MNRINQQRINSLKKIFTANVYLITVIAGILISASCIREPEKKANSQYDFSKVSLSNPEIASGFQIHEFENIQLLEVITGSTTFRFYLVGEEDKDLIFEDGQTIHIPLHDLVCLSATHLSFLDALGEIDKLIGVSNAEFVVSQKFRARVDSGKIKEIGLGDHFKLEELINLSPDLVMVSPQKGNNFEALANAGITVVPNADYLEAHPLGRAEWIKFVGVLTGKEDQAIHIFDSIKDEYNRLKKLTANLSQRPSVISGKQYGGFWNLPGGNSYVACLIKDAGANYLWSVDEGTGGVTLDFESVYAKGLHADFWRFLVYSPVKYSYQILVEEDERYENFDAFKNKKVLYCNTFDSPYFQRGLMEPQILLADYIHIFHPELLPDYQNQYYHILR